MAKGSALSKRIKISEAQQTVILACLGASVMLGVSLALVTNYFNQIGFYADIIGKEDQAISNYSQTVANMGVCVKPKGQVYTRDELKRCNPNLTDISSVAGSLRYNILYNLASNEGLGSVQRYNSACINPESELPWTYDEMDEMINEAQTDDEFIAANTLMKTCSSLRVVSDALPDYKNESALLASLNKIFNLSNTIPESISPADSYESEYDEMEEVPVLQVNEISFSLESPVSSIYTFLTNMEKSIREFAPTTAKLEYLGDRLDFSLQAKAFYVEKAGLDEQNTVVKFKKDGK